MNYYNDEKQIVIRVSVSDYKIKREVHLTSKNHFSCYIINSNFTFLVNGFRGKKSRTTIIKHIEVAN